MNESVVILEVGAEGGSITLYGVQIDKKWRFGRNVIDQTALLLGETSTEHQSPVVDTWSKALAVLDEYPWHNLYPVKVHPEFRAAVLDAVIARHKKSEGAANSRRLSNWKEVCAPSPR